MNRLILFSVLLLIVGSCDTEKTVSPDFNNYFVKYYGMDGNQFAVDLYHNEAEQAVYILGRSELNGSKIYVAKVNYNGNLVWETEHTAITGVPSEDPRDIELGADGRFIILSNSAEGIRLYRLTTDGVFEEDALLPDGGSGNAVTALADGSFIVTGSVPDDTPDLTNNLPIDPDFEDIIAVRFNASLEPDPSWLNPIGGQFEGAGVRVFPGTSNRYFLFGYSDEPRGSDVLNLNFYVAGLDDFGAPFASFPIGDINNLERSAYAFQAPPELNNVFVMVGTQTVAVPGTGTPTETEYLYMTKVFPNIDFTIGQNNLAGPTKLIENPIGPKLQGIGACATVHSQFGFVISGIQTNAEGLSNIWVGKVDLSGKLLWSNAFGFSENNDEGSSVVELPDGRILLSGTVSLENQRKIALIKLNSRGNLSN